MKKLLKKGVITLLLCGILTSVATGCASDNLSSGNVDDTANNSVVTSTELLDSSKETETSEESSEKESSSKADNKQESSSSKKQNSSKEEASSKEESSSKPLSSKEESSSKEDISSNTSSSIKPQETLIITCYGDSVTQGMSVENHETYPSVLKTLLGSQYIVQNAGDGGEKTTAIMARQGAIKIYTKNEVKFEKGETAALLNSGVGRGFIAEDGREASWNDPYGRDVPIKKVTINGETYSLEFRNFSWSKSGSGSTCDTYLVRENTDKEETIPANSEAVLNTTTISKNNYCDIYFMGFNGDYNNIDDLISQYKKMIDYRNDDNYLVIVPSWERKYSQGMFEKFKAAFGDHVVDAVEYCINGGLDELGITLEKYDAGCLENEVFPYSLKLETIKNRRDVHLNAKGYRVLANAVYKQGQKLNLW